MQIKILSARQITDLYSSDWLTEIEISDGGETYTLNAGASGEIAEMDLQAHFEKQAATILRTAKHKGKRTK